MLRASPAPRPSRRRRWIWALTAGTGLFAAAVGFVAAFPWWGEGLARDEIVARVESRTGLNVELSGLELDYSAAHLDALRASGEGIDLELRDLDIKLDRDAVWELRAEVDDVAVGGGHLIASRAALEELARKLQADAQSSAEAASERGGRVRATPRTLDIRALDLELTDGDRRLVGLLSAKARPRDRSVDVALANAEFVASERSVRAVRVATSVDVSAGTPAVPLLVEVEGLATAITPQIALAGVSGTIEVKDDQAAELGLDLQGSFSEAGGAGSSKVWTVRGEGRRDLSAGRVDLTMSRFELGRVPELLAALPLIDSEKASAGGELHVEFSGGVAQLKGEVDLAGLNVRHDLLAREVVRDIGLHARVDATVDPAAWRVDLHGLELERGGVALHAEGTIVHPPDPEARRYDVRLVVPSVPCQSVLGAIPRELVPALQGFELAGEFEADLHIGVDMADLEELTLEGGIDLWGCKAKQVPPRVSAARLGGSFIHRVQLRDGSTRSLRLFPGSSDFTPLDQISPFMIAAVQTTEDGSFWRHRGFLPSQFAEALRRNLQAGRVRLGASTISMQMVKNVLLSHERTLSRKLQELFLTWHTEQSISKRRIMEVYLNVIEYGPGIYGISHAAEHYFGRHPHELSSLEAMYLAMMLPSPVRRHVHYCRGAPSPRFDAKLRRNHGLMFSRGRISELDYITSKDAELVFDLRDRRSEGECLGEIERLKNGEHTQRALTGVLEAGPNWEPAPASTIEPSEMPLPDVGGQLGEAPGLPEEQDPSMSDAPGIPAMDQP